MIRWQRLLIELQAESNNRERERLLTELQVEFVNRERELTHIRTLESELRSSPLTPKRFYDITAKSLLTLCGAEGAQVLLRRGNDLQVVASIPETEIGRRIPVAQCASGICVETKQPLRSGDIWSDDRIRNRFVNVMGDQLGSKPISELAVPITLSGEVIGVLNVESTRADAFDEHHEGLIGLVADQASLAFTRLQLVNETDLLSDLYRIATDLLSDESRKRPNTDRDIELYDVLNSALVGLEQYLGPVEHFQILFTQDDSLVIAFSSIGKDIGLTVDLDSVTGRAVRKAESQVVGDVRTDPHYRRVLGTQMLSEMAVPLLVGTRVVGVLNIESDRVQAFDSFSEVIVQNFSRDIEHLTIMLKVIYDLQARLRRQEALDVIMGIGHQASNLIHRINNIVGAIRLWSEEIQKDCAAELAQNEFLSSSVARIHSNAVKALEIPRDMKRRFSTVGTVDVNATIEQELVHFEGRGSVTIKTSLDPKLPRIRCPSFGNIVSNLVQNAINAIDGTGTIHISTALTKFPMVRGSYVELQVADTGRGIPNNVLSSIFTFGVGGEKGLGFGLAWVKTFVESVGGKIAVETSTEKPAGSTFTIRLPGEPEQPS